MNTTVSPDAVDEPQRLHDRYVAEYNASGATVPFTEWLEFQYHFEQCNNHDLRKKVRSLETQLHISRLPDPRFSK